MTKAPFVDMNPSERIGVEANKPVWTGVQYEMGQSGGLCEQMFNMQMGQSGVFVCLIRKWVYLKVCVNKCSIWKRDNMISCVNRCSIWKWDDLNLCESKFSIWQYINLEVYFSLYVLHGLDLLSVKKEEKAKHHHLLVCCSLYLGVHCYVTYEYTQYLGTQSRACVFVFIIAFSLARLVGLLIGT